MTFLFSYLAALSFCFFRVFGFGFGFGFFFVSVLVFALLFWTFCFFAFFCGFLILNF
jgi:hypothetical protein